MASQTFKGEQDRYNGITVDSQEEPCETSQFLNQLNGKCIFKYDYVFVYIYLYCI